MDMMGFNRQLMGISPTRVCMKWDLAINTGLYNVGRPSYNLVKKNMNTVISIINHRIQPLIRQLNAIERGPHIVSVKDQDVF